LGAKHQNFLAQWDEPINIFTSPGIQLKGVGYYDFSSSRETAQTRAIDDNSTPIDADVAEEGVYFGVFLTQAELGLSTSLLLRQNTRVKA
jgi:hypothetical protein